MNNWIDNGHEMVNVNFHVACPTQIDDFKGCPFPEVGKKYRFFDDGKTGFSRRYYAFCTKIIPFDEASEELKEGWKENGEECPWLYNKNTDFFIECSIPHYEDELPVYFARTRDGDWFSFDYPNTWMSGRLDVTGDYFTKAGWSEEDWECQWD